MKQSFLITVFFLAQVWAQAQGLTEFERADWQLSKEQAQSLQGRMATLEARIVELIQQKEALIDQHATYMAFWQARRVAQERQLDQLRKHHEMLLSFALEQEKKANGVMYGLPVLDKKLSQIELGIERCQAALMALDMKLLANEVAAQKAVQGIESSIKTIAIELDKTLPVVDRSQAEKLAWIQQVLIEEHDVASGFFVDKEVYEEVGPRARIYQAWLPIAFRAHLVKGQK